jgi:uncharacterized membrane protein YbaN (DUF454 family)
MRIKIPTKMPKSKWVRFSLGIIFLFLGVIGLFLPVLQGVAFLIIGAALLGFPPAVRLFEKTIHFLSRKKGAK